MKHLSLSLLILLLFHFSYSQDDKQKAHELCLSGIQEMDKGEIENALSYFEQARSLDPDNFFYPYEIGHAYFLTRQYKKSIQVLEPLLQHKDATDHVYHLLGSSYEYSGNVKKAQEIYSEALIKFPDSGILHNALGSYYLKKKNYREALSYFERGIKAEPAFSDNYYWASKVHASLEDKLWGIIYAEIFINSEGVNEKSRELGKMIFDVYQNGITISEDTILIELADADTSYKNFEDEFEKTFSQSASSVKKDVSISSICEIRKAFILDWIGKGNHDRYPNLLFDWQALILLKGYWEPYHYWLLKEGKPEAFQTWVSQNQEVYNDFINWLSLNHLTPSPSAYFVTTQYSSQF